MRVRSLVLVTVAVALIASPAAVGATGRLGIPRADAPGEASADAIMDWSLIAQNSIVVVAKKFPGVGAGLMGIVHAAIYDATVAIEGRFQPFAVAPEAPPNTSLEAAVATAAYGVLVGLFPDQQGSLDATYDAYLSSIPDGEAKDNGITLGEEVFEGILELPAVAGLTAAPTPYEQPPPGPGVYEPTGPIVLGTNLPDVVPLVLESASQFRPDGPSALTSDEYADDFNEVKALGRADSTDRTPEQTATALFWTDNDIAQWNRAMVRLADREDLDATETARMLALAHVAGGDAMIACFDAKFHYNFWRPTQAIPRADTDGNPTTEPDPTWVPLRTTPPFPEYPSAHACHSGAVTTVLAAIFGNGQINFTLDSLVTGETRYYRHFGDAIREVNNARVWAGFHFRNSDVEGSTLGRRVARFVLENAFQPVQ